MRYVLSAAVSAILILGASPAMACSIATWTPSEREKIYRISQRNLAAEADTIFIARASPSRPSADDPFNSVRTVTPVAVARGEGLLPSVEDQTLHCITRPRREEIIVVFARNDENGVARAISSYPLQDIRIPSVHRQARTALREAER
ncbi:hypothetical protein E4M02_12560 [Brevundimonas sp. S30B]|uniref:hypothetical protein n=1 Tax=unclassified Brevundimonas TaxID=2622653 RepID=UPI0010715EC3|nr:MULTISPECIES: hypothetical protein [unclassified Brevundimonas]QBX36386.1 hypothetical protein E4M01_00620 [Brevundimonas sp. MF30-B]TFW01095.1 hypothetical protein E4M02_12560 [Brevundimonas sp. S30B]